MTEQTGGRETVDEQHAVEVVVFVLGRAGHKLVELVVNLLPGEIVSGNDDLFRPFHRGVDFGEAQAAFLGLDGPAPLDDHRIEKDILLARLRIAPGIEDEEPVRQIDLVGGQPDALLRVHQVEHLADGALQLAVDAAQRFRLVAQGGVRVLDDSQHSFQLRRWGGILNYRARPS